MAIRGNPSQGATRSGKDKDTCRTKNTCNPQSCFCRAGLPKSSNTRSNCAAKKIYDIDSRRTRALVARRPLSPFRFPIARAWLQGAKLGRIGRICTGKGPSTACARAQSGANKATLMSTATLERESRSCRQRILRVCATRTVRIELLGACRRTESPQGQFFERKTQRSMSVW